MQVNACTTEVTFLLSKVVFIYKTNSSNILLFIPSFLIIHDICVVTALLDVTFLLLNLYLFDKATAK